MVHPSFQPLRTSEPEDDNDFEHGGWEGAEDDILMERPEPPISRQVRSMLPLTLRRLSLGVVRNGKVASCLAMAVVGVLALSLLAELGRSADGLRAARARTQDSVEENGMMQQTGQQDKATVQAGAVQAVSAGATVQAGATWAQYGFENSLSDTSGSGRYLVSGSSWSPTYVAGVVGQAVSLDAPSAEIAGSSNSWLKGPVISSADVSGQYFEISFRVALVSEGYNHGELLLAFTSSSDAADSIPMLSKGHAEESIDFGGSSSTSILSGASSIWNSAWHIVKLSTSDPCSTSTWTLEFDGTTYSSEFASICDRELHINHHCWNGGATCSTRINMMLDEMVITSGAPAPITSGAPTQGGVYYQSATQGAAVVQTAVGATQGAAGSCNCCCASCGCDKGSVAFCSSMTCPTGYVQREGGQHIECRGDTCSLETDLSMCCNRRATCDGDRGTYTCKPGYSLKDKAELILCESHSCGPEDNDLCCDSTPQKQVSVEIEKEATVNIEKHKEVTVEKPKQDIMICDLNCYNEGVDSVSVELPEEEVKDLDSCRDSCIKNEECSGIVYKKDFETTGASTCHGKKDIHAALCQPGGEYFTEVLKHRPWGKCALLGDPHIMQWDRPPQLGKSALDNYDAGDYILMSSQELTIHARFGFTERFPEATSTKGIAVHGSKVNNKVLVAGYSERSKRFIAWYDGKEILKSKGESFDDGHLVAKYDDMDPTEFHSEARHTIGQDADKVASWTFEWKAVPLKIYMLLGPDNVNAVLEIQKLEYPMDGLCGNFNCDPDDDDDAALSGRSVYESLSWSHSIFFKAEGTFHEKVFVKGSVDEEVLTNCDPDLLKKGRDACGMGNGVDDAQAKACLVDVCEAKSVDVAAMDVETVSIEQEVDHEVDTN